MTNMLEKQKNINIIIKEIDKLNYDLINFKNQLNEVVNLSVCSFEKMDKHIRNNQSKIENNIYKKLGAAVAGKVEKSMARIYELEDELKKEKKAFEKLTNMKLESFSKYIKDNKEESPFRDDEE